MKGPAFQTFVRISIAVVWLFHGLYSKILDGVPRHRLIVGQILGDEHARSLTLAIGFGEILLGLWVLSGRYALANAAFQTLLLITMNTLEIIFAKDLLISAYGMLALNSLLLGAAWWLAIWPQNRDLRSSR
jgi:uncharacterized membrane protein YphA (DoxX/SURF4 family)